MGHCAVMVPITSELVDDAAARLAGAGWRFTPRQLYYAACAAAETPVAPRSTAARGVAGLGVLLVLLGLVFIWVRLVFAVLAVGGALLLALGAALRFRPRPADPGRVLAMPYGDFVARFCVAPRPGMIGAVGTPRLALRDAAPLVACDSAETAALVAANLERADAVAAVLDQGSLPGQLAGVSVVTLHDASPGGCSLGADARARGAARVADAGLRPAEAMAARLQVIEGAPAQVPDAALASLSADEARWLAEGRRLELAVLTPEAVMDRVSRALSGLAG